MKKADEPHTHTLGAQARWLDRDPPELQRWPGPRALVDPVTDVGLRRAVLLRPAGWRPGLGRGSRCAYVYPDCQC